MSEPVTTSGAITHFSEDGEVYIYELQTGEAAHVEQIFENIENDQIAGIGQRVATGQCVVIIRPDGTRRSLHISEMRHIPAKEWRTMENDRKRVRIREVIKILRATPSTINDRVAMY